MKKLWFGAILLAGLIVFPILSPAQVDVRINVPIPLPPPIPFVAPPNVIVLPGTDVYAVPDVQEDIFFRGGWWWRPWQGNWYRSKFHDRGWSHYRGAPSWYGRVPRDWRHNYSNHVWGGRSWRPPSIRHGGIDQHWRGGHWRNDHGWGRPGGRSGGRTLRGGKSGGRTYPDGRTGKSNRGGSKRGDRR